MPLYEHVYLARQDLSAQQVEEMTTGFKGVIEGLGGQVVGTPEYWGVKSLSFHIRKNRKAHMTLFNIDAPAPAIAEMERTMSHPGFKGITIGDHIAGTIVVHERAPEFAPAVSHHAAPADAVGDEVVFDGGQLGGRPLKRVGAPGGTVG